jgi:hypothetical protein
LLTGRLKWFVIFVIFSEWLTARLLRGRPARVNKPSMAISDAAAASRWNGNQAMTQQFCRPADRT